MRFRGQRRVRGPQRRLEAANRSIVADLANDDGHGTWVCAELEPNRPDIDLCAAVKQVQSERGGGAASPPDCWLPADIVNGASMLPACARNVYDEKVLPHALRCLANQSFNEFQAELVRAFPGAFLGGWSFGGRRRRPGPSAGVEEPRV